MPIKTENYIKIITSELGNNWEKYAFTPPPRQGDSTALHNFLKPFENCTIRLWGTDCPWTSTLKDKSAMHKFITNATTADIGTPSLYLCFDENGFSSIKTMKELNAFQKTSNNFFAIPSHYLSVGGGKVGRWIDSTSVCYDGKYCTEKEVLDFMNLRKNLESAMTKQDKGAISAAQEALRKCEHIASHVIIDAKAPDNFLSKDGSTLATPGKNIIFNSTDLTAFTMMQYFPNFSTRDTEDFKKYFNTSASGKTASFRNAAAKAELCDVIRRWVYAQVTRGNACGGFVVLTVPNIYLQALRPYPQCTDAIYEALGGALGHIANHYDSISNEGDGIQGIILSASPEVSKKLKECNKTKGSGDFIRLGGGGRKGSQCYYYSDRVCIIESLDLGAPGAILSSKGQNIQVLSPVQGNACAPYGNNPWQSGGREQDNARCTAMLPYYHYSTLYNKNLCDKERLYDLRCEIDAVEAGLSFDEHAAKLKSEQAEPDEERHIVPAEIDELKSLSDKVDDQDSIRAQYSRDVAEEWLMQRIWRKVVQFIYDLLGIDESVTLERKLADSLKVVEAAQNGSKSTSQYASTDAMEPDIGPKYNPPVSLSSSIPSSVSGPALLLAPPPPPPPPPPLPSGPLPPPPSGAAQSTMHKQDSFTLAGIKDVKLKKVPSPDQNQAKSRGPSGSSGGIDLSDIKNAKQLLKAAPITAKVAKVANSPRDLLMSGIMDKANKRDTNKINIEEAIRRNKEQIDQQKQNKEDSAELKDVFKRALDARRIKIEDADSRDQDSDDGWDDEPQIKKTGPQTKPKPNVGSATSTMAAGAQNKKGTPPAP